MTDSELPRSDHDAREQPTELSDEEQARSWGLCSAFMSRLNVSGAVISIVDLGGHRSTVAATDVVASRWDDIELEVGAGPLHSAIRDATIHLVPDVRHSSLNPILGSELDDLGVRAAFAFPLSLGSAIVGVVGLYNTTPGELTVAEVRTATHLARSVTGTAVRVALQLAAHDSTAVNDPTDTRHAPELRREVHQATGMISAQLDVAMTEAFARLRAHAISTERSMIAIARDVVSGSINFRDLA